MIDHVAYREQAEQLLDGHLSMPLDDDAPSWAVRFTTVTDHGRVFKYLPGTAAIGAASIELTGDVGLALAGSLGLVVLATSGVAGRLGWSPQPAGGGRAARRRVARGPLQQHRPAELRALAGAVDDRRVDGARRHLDRPAAPPSPTSPDDHDRPRSPTGDRHRLLLLAGAGLVLGFALLVRQIEVVTWTARARRLVPAAPRRPRAGTRVTQAATLLVATIPGILVVLAVNRHVTGDPLQFPFTLVSPQDGMGWGLRRVLPTDALETFHLSDGVRTTPRASFDLLLWTLAGPALAVGAAVTIWVRRRSPRSTGCWSCWPASIPLAFLFHWANAHAVRGGFYMTVGPFYYLPCVPPLVLLGVEGLARLPRRAVVAVVAVVLLVQAAFLTNHLWRPVGLRPRREPTGRRRSRPDPADAPTCTRQWRDGARNEGIGTERPAGGSASFPVS